MLTTLGRHLSLISLIGLLAACSAAPPAVEPPSEPQDPCDGPFAAGQVPPACADSDGDGILDRDDKCPAFAEDLDGFHDTDGCPDPDNDRDGVPDADDLCPMEPEDMNGYQDEDGCPESRKILMTR